MRNYKVIAEGNKQTILEMVRNGCSKSEMYKTLNCNRRTFDKVLEYLNIDYDYYSQTRTKDGLKKCSNCNELKDLSMFYKNGSRKTAYCIDCTKNREKESYSAKVKAVADYKTSHGCKKCGNKKHYLLDFHHVDRSQKEFTVSSKARCSLDSLMKEISKCVVLCSNCHREFHHFEREQDMTIEKYLKE